MTKNRRRPLIGIPACRRQIDPHPFHVAGEKYVKAVMEGAGGLPVLIPPLGEQLDLDEVLAHVDGVLLTGSPSNVEPHHYGGSSHDSVPPHDPHRDATTLPLIRAAVERDVPLFAICRGTQEMNVAFGGTLFAKVHEAPGKSDHREDKTLPLEMQYEPAHDVHLCEGGILRSLARSDTVRVNSLHNQGVAKLGEGLSVEAVAPDGLVEAFRVAEVDRFALGVQWHPEWKVRENPFSLALFQAFAQACKARAGLQ